MVKLLNYWFDQFPSREHTVGMSYGCEKEVAMDERLRSRWQKCVLPCLEFGTIEFTNFLPFHRRHRQHRWQLNVWSKRNNSICSIIHLISNKVQCVHSTETVDNYGLKQNNKARIKIINLYDSKLWNHIDKKYTCNSKWF